MINFILWLLFGALVGWLASIVMRTDAQQGALLNIVVGIIGAMLGGFIFSLLGIGGSSINNSDLPLMGFGICPFLGKFDWHRSLSWERAVRSIHW